MHTHLWESSVSVLANDSKDTWYPAKILFPKADARRFRACGSARTSPNCACVLCITDGVKESTLGRAH